jgi:PleD family two-component response regulator
VLPYVDERGAEAMVEDIKRLVEINNQYYSQLQLNLSIGTATTTPGETLEAVAKRADLLMYENKRQQYSSKGGLL